MKYADMNIKNSVHRVDTISPEKKSHKGVAVILIFFITLGLVGYFFRDKIKGMFDPVSVVASVASAKLKETDGRTNILLLGSDKRSQGPITSVLTDTILIASIGKADNDVVLISVPRDLWVQSPNGSHSKINEVYITAERNQKGSGPKELEKTLEEVLGIPIHYYALVTFDMFEQAIDILGGVDVTVDKSFTDYNYPIEGKENAPENERYETVHFEAGMVKMDGKTALKFVRSRHGDNGEDTDFARSKRQQKIIAAIKNEALSLETLLDFNKLKALYETYSGNVDTDIDLATIQTFYLISKQMDMSKVVSVVLDDRSDANDGGLLYAPEDRTLYGNLYVLIPQTGDYSQIHAFVQRYLFGNK